MTECGPSIPRPGQSAEQTFRAPSMSRGRTMEAMMAFIKPSPFGFRAESSTFSGSPVLNNACNCERPMRNIVCRSCGFLCRGRVQTRCPQHNDVIHLMDIGACPGCQATTLKEFGTAAPKK